MKGTSILQFKSWPKIHQPLPRTPRESQQLLNALTSSFRRQLDHSYPANAPTQNGDRSPSNDQSSVHATDQHMQTILNNPLFRIVPPKLAAALDHHARQGLEKQKRLTEEPMVVLDELVASGSATHTAIMSCLNSQLLLARSPGKDGLKAMTDARAASRVVDLFWASDGPSRATILTSWKMTTSLTKFMVAEGLQDTAMQWLRMLLNRDVGTPNGQIPVHSAQVSFSCFLDNLVQAEHQYGGGFGSAMKYYLRACDIVFDSPHHQSKASRKPLLIAAGGNLAQTANHIKPSSEQVPAHTYEEYTEVLSTLSPRSLLSAAVSLCHPVYPDPQPLVQFARSLSPEKVQTWNKSKRSAFLTNGCDALRILIEQKKIQEATELAQRIQHLLPENTKVKSTDTQEPRSEISFDGFLLHRLNLNLNLT
ncbi:hypothetical protein N7492_008373 [Penicillium capsulatum]|uniref:Uncharacterized protein n=1 Tax=Penicillium capsulatum TaxID=69766 RepID=A0A9W9HSK2_9EURO|nr:hypothetical protein N7492_008373 [Penicillium capsulatum]KAJ6105775.1 hypothetical protein N7512_009292 [Penicillium capsulatum]